MSVGHSIHLIDEFVSLLRRHGVEMVADVRSSPFSRFNPQYNLQPLRLGISQVGIRYLFLGEELGGKPEGDEFYDPDDHVLYGRIAKTERFESGLARLIESAKRSRVAIMCSEENPARCHRFLLVTRVLHGRSVRVTHIRGNGIIQRTDEVSTFEGWSDPVYEKRSLFDEDESVRSPWRSTQSVLRRRRPWRDTSCSAVREPV